MERDQALALVALLQAGYPGRPLPDPSVNLYAEELLPHDYEAGQRAVRWLIRNSRWLPSIAELIEEAGANTYSQPDLNRPALPTPKAMTEEEVKAAKAPLRAYLRRIGRLSSDQTKKAHDQEVAEKRAKAKSLSEETA